MHYPRVVYHPNYKSSMSEKEREAHAKVVKSKEQHMEYFPQWGEHPEIVKPEEKHPVQPPVDDAHVSEGASLFSNPKMKKGKSK